MGFLDPRGPLRIPSILSCPVCVSWAGTSQPIYISTGYLNLYSLNHFSWNFSVFVFVFVCVFVIVIVIVIAGGLWIACVISFQNLYGLTVVLR